MNVDGRWLICSSCEQLFATFFTDQKNKPFYFSCEPVDPVPARCCVPCARRSVGAAAHRGSVTAQWCRVGRSMRAYVWLHAWRRWRLSRGRAQIDEPHGCTREKCAVCLHAPAGIRNYFPCQVCDASTYRCSYLCVYTVKRASTCVYRVVHARGTSSSTSYDLDIIQQRSSACVYVMSC